MTALRSFNPRAHVGRDKHAVYLGAPGEKVSIHAPTWGATSNAASQHSWSEFQSTRPRGARPKAQSTSQILSTFQSTRPRGARQCASLMDIANNGFNPRAHVGRDLLLEPLVPTNAMFQSTRPRGARPGMSRAMYNARSFNPRAHVGRDYISLTHAKEQSCFNPRAHVGRDSVGCLQILCARSFNPRAHVGRDRQFNPNRSLGFLYVVRQREIL